MIVVDLYKFMRREYLQSFLDGQLYLNSIGFFWSHGFEKQSDFFEGASEMGSSCNMPFPDNLKKNIKGSVVYRLNAYKYWNVLCFYKQEYDPVKKQVLRVDKRMKPFGDVAVRIKYLNSFVDRVEDYAKVFTVFQWQISRRKRDQEVKLAATLKPWYNERIQICFCAYSLQTDRRKHGEDRFY